MLGFTAKAMKNWVDKDGKAYTDFKKSIKVRDLATTFLATPNVLAFGRKYFNCDTLAGVPLEN